MSVYYHLLNTVSSIKQLQPSDMKQQLSVVNHPLSLLSDVRGVCVCVVSRDESLHKAGRQTCINVLSKHLLFWIQASVCESCTHCKETPKRVMVVIVLVTDTQDDINGADVKGKDMLNVLKSVCYSRLLSPSKLNFQVVINQAISKEIRLDPISEGHISIMMLSSYTEKLYPDWSLFHSVLLWFPVVR